MDKKIIRRGKSKKQADSHARTGVKKKLPEVTKEKEERERLEAANILSSLKFMAPSSSDSNTEESEPVNAAHNTSRGVTYLRNSTTGISTIGAPSGVVTKGGQTVVGGTVTVIKPDGLAQLARIPLCTGTISRELFTQLFTLKALNSKKSPTVQNNVKPSDTVSLPTTLNPVKTVNRSVATALRHVVAQNTKINPNNEVIKSIKEKIQKKNPDCELNTDDATNNKVPQSNADKTDSVDIKKETTETSLPLKKRRLVSLLGTQPSDTPSNRLSDLSTAVQMENILNLARDYPDQYTDRKQRDQSLDQKPTLQASSTITSFQSEGYKPVSFDPRTSLLVLSDLKTALTPDEDGDLPIHIAVVHENTELVKKFIDIMAMSGKSVDRYNKLQQTPLHLAVLVDKPDIVQALLHANADPNLVDRNGCTSCHIAVTKQFRDCLKQIFTDSRKRVEVNTRNYEGYSPLHTSVELGDLKSMKFLIERGASTYINLNIQDGKAGRSVLFYATEYKRLKMVEYLVSCGANVDLQNYAGVSALMTAQAGGFDDISHILTRALENKKGIEESISVPLSQLPSKLKLSIPDSSAIRSKSGSSSFEVKAGSRRSSTSSTSPMDLSIQRKIKSPGSNGPGRRSKQNSIDSEIDEKLALTEIERMNSKRIKEKHTQLVAALEDRNYLTPSQQGYIEGFLTTLQFYEKVNRNRGLSDMQDIASVKGRPKEHQDVKEEPMDTDAQSDQVRNHPLGSEINHFQMETKSSNDIGRRNLCYGISNDSASMDTGDKQAPVLKDVCASSQNISENNMEVQDSPNMPVLSLAMSLTEKASEGETLLESPDESNSSQINDDSVNQTELNENRHLETSTANLQSSQESSQGFEVQNKLTTDNSIAGVVKTSVKLTEEKDLACNETLELRSNSDSEMDINAIEMDAEDDEEMEGSLVIDENVAAENSVVADKATIVEHDDGDSVMLETSTLDNESSGNTDTVINSGGVGKESDSFKLKNVEDSCDNNLSMGIQISEQTDIGHGHSSPQTEKVTEPLEPGHIAFNTDKHLHRQNSLPIESSQSFKSSTGSLNEKILSKIIKDKEIRQAGLGSLNLEKLTHLDKSKSDTVLPTGQTRTLYIREGENYKPIKIFVDGSPQSSLVLQRMLEQAQGNSNINTGNFTFVKSDTRQTKPVVDNSKVNMTTSTNLISQTPALTSTVPKLDNSKVNTPSESQTDKPGTRSESYVTKDKQDNANDNSGDHNATITLRKSAEAETLRKELGSRRSFQDTITNQVKVSVSKVIQEPTSQSSASLQTKVTESVSETIIKNPDSNSNKSVESVPDNNSYKLPSNSSSVTGSETNLTHSTIKTSVSPTTYSSVPKSTSSVKLGSGPTITSQSKVASLIQNRNAVSTSEGTLTWVNPDIKSRLSKALSSPQRKLGAKVSSQEGESALSNHQNVQVVGTNSS